MRAAALSLRPAFPRPRFGKPQRELPHLLLQFFNGSCGPTVRALMDLQSLPGLL